jgi:hypothetical protein
MQQGSIILPTEDKMNWSRVTQVALNAGFSVLSVKMPRFERASRWAGDLAESCDVVADWIAIPLGPLRLVLIWFMARRVRAIWAAMPMKQRLVVGGTAALLSGLCEAFEQLCPGAVANFQVGSKG